MFSMEDYCSASPVVLTNSMRNCGCGCGDCCWPRDKKSMSSKAHLPRMLYVDSASLLYLESYKSRDKNADDSINHAGIQLLNFIGISTFDHSL